MIRNLATSAVAALLLVAGAGAAHADDLPPVEPGSGHTSTSCLYERYWTDSCPAPWVISAAEEDAQAAAQTPAPPAAPPTPQKAGTTPHRAGKAQPATRRPAPSAPAPVEPSAPAQTYVPLRPVLASVPGRSVRVEAGDSLWALAVEELGDGARWPEIAELNDMPGVGSPVIYVGEALRLPSR